MNTPLLLALAIYTPLADMASAVIAPEHASSENVEDLVQSTLDIVTSSKGMYVKQKQRGRAEW